MKYSLKFLRKRINDRIKVLETTCGFTKGFADARIEELGDVLMVLNSIEQELREMKEKIEKNSKWNTDELRSNNPKSERRISVLHSRIELYQFFIKQLEEILGE